MASPAVVGGRASRSSASSGAVAAARVGVRQFAPGRGYVLVLLALTFAALLSRVYTTNSLAGEPTPDEYLYGVNARELARGWASGQPVSLESLGVDGRSVVVESAALSMVLPWDPITIGRTMQALFNALCVPMTFVLGRQIGLTRSAAAAAAVLLMAVPEFQELAWRFWTDSQTTFLCLVYVSALVAFSRRPSATSGVLSVGALGLLLLTKESAAVTFAPFLALAAVIPLSRRLTGSSRRYAALVAAVLVAVFVGLGLAIARVPADLGHNSLVERTIGVAPLVFSSIRNAIPVVPSYSLQLVSVIGPVEFGTGFLWATLVGFAWLVAQAAVALVTNRTRPSTWVLGWVVASIVWIPAMVTPWRDLASLRQTDPWVAVAAGALLVSVGAVELHLRNARRTGWGLALLGLIVVAVLSERLIISVTPKVSGAALTFRSLMPVVPLFALAAGGGLWSAANAVALLLPRARWVRPAFTVAATAMLVLFWSPLVRERLSDHPLVGRIADRGADPDTPQGLRVQVLVEAQSWLQANLRPSDVVLAGVGMPRALAWYADLGVDSNVIDLGSQPRTLDQKRRYILDRVGPQGVAYVVDFNVDWTDPGGDKARHWRQTFDMLLSRPNLEAAYVARDRFGYPVFYVVRNHGYAVAQPP